MGRDEVARSDTIGERKLSVPLADGFSAVFLDVVVELQAVAAGNSLRDQAALRTKIKRVSTRHDRDAQCCNRCNASALQPGWRGSGVAAMKGLVHELR